MSTKSAMNTTTSADSEKVVVSFSSDSEKSSSSASSSSSESSSESDAETTTQPPKPSKASTPPPPPTTTTETVEEDEVETVSFTLSLSVASNDIAADDARKNEEKVDVEPKTTTTSGQETTTNTAAAAASDEVKQTRQESPRKSPGEVIKPAESDAKQKISTKKTTTKAATKSSSTAGAVNGSDAVADTTVKTGEVGVPAEPSKKPASVSQDAANAVTLALSSSTAETAVEEDDMETVSFTLSLSAVSNDDSVAEETTQKDQQREPETTNTGRETTKTVAAAAADEVKQTPDAVTKSAENDAGESKKKTSAKKTAKPPAKSSKAEAINGGEEVDGVPNKIGKAAAVTEEKVVATAEPTKKSASVSDEVANAVNGETKTAAKTVKKKTKKASGDNSTDTVVEERLAVKESVTQNEAAIKTESPTTKIIDESSSVVNGEAKPTAKTTKKKTVKKASTESKTVAVTEDKEVSSKEDKPAKKATTEQKVPAVKSEPIETLSAVGGDAEASVASEETKSATKTTVIKKKTKKVAGDVSSKSSVTQEDVAVTVENSTTNENSAGKQDVKLKDSQEAQAEKSAAVETRKIAQETTISSADNDAAASESTTSDKVIAKKKKPKKSAAESAEVTLNNEMEHVSASITNVDVTSVAAADADLSYDVTVSIITENAVAEPAAASKEAISSKDVAKSPAPFVPLIATTDETEVSNVVTLIQLDDAANEPHSSFAPVGLSSSAGVSGAQTKPEVIRPTSSSTDTSADAMATTDDGAKDSKNEESDYSYRRKSMDEFIKRILAEAREEQQKRMATTTNNSGPDSATILDLESTANDSDKLDPCLSPTDIEVSMLDRRLASADRRRTQKEEWTSKNVSRDVDLDQDLAEIGQYFAKRNHTGTNRYDVEMEKNGSRVRDVRQLDVDSITAKSIIAGQESQRPQQNGLPEESFVPRAREETAELVSNSSRPVRAIIDQQSDVTQLLKTTARSVDDLEAEMRALRATFLDRQARIDTLRTAVDAEVRAYQADQQAASDRIQQQHIPGGHFVRDEFMRANNIAPSSNRSSAIDELLGGASPRRRSGSVSSTSGIVSGGTAASGMSSGELDYNSSTFNSWVLLGTRSDQPRRNDFDDDVSSTASGYSTTRSRRGGSVVRERSYMVEDPMASRMDRSYLLTYDTSSPSNYTFGDQSMRPTNYPPLQTSSQTRSYYQTDYGPTSSSSAAAVSSYYGGTDARGYYGGHGYSSFGSAATNDPSKFRRAQSVSDFSSERSTSGDRAYNAAAFSSAAGGQFQSRFLDRVRARKAYGDDQYRSRFLAPDSGSSSSYYSTRRNYSSND